MSSPDRLTEIEQFYRGYERCLGMMSGEGFCAQCAPRPTWMAAVVAGLALPRMALASCLRTMRSIRSRRLGFLRLDRFLWSRIVSSASNLFIVIACCASLWGAGPPVTDNFNTPTLNTSLWTFVNPVGNGSFSMTGTQLQLNVPAGSNHDPVFGARITPRGSCSRSQMWISW